jgi:signal transduction histidine kinase
MKTPLMAIGGFANQVLRKLNRDDPNRKKLDTIIQETTRLETMVRGMLDFGRAIELQTKKTNLNELAQDSMEVTQAMAKKLKQVLLNLMTNAVQASQAGEQILIKTCSTNGGVVLDVIDHGCGITEENRGSVFHPFFSTKKGGAGLGLGIAKKIVEAHRGEISFYPNTQKGITFRVRFPF